MDNNVGDKISLEDSSDVCEEAENIYPCTIQCFEILQYTEPVNH